MALIQQAFSAFQAVGFVGTLALAVSYGCFVFVQACWQVYHEKGKPPLKWWLYALVGVVIAVGVAGLYFGFGLIGYTFWKLTHIPT